MRWGFRRLRYEKELYKIIKKELQLLATVQLKLGQTLNDDEVADDLTSVILEHFKLTKAK